MKRIITFLAVCTLATGVTNAQSWRQFGNSLNGSSAGSDVGQGVSLSADAGVMALGGDGFAGVVEKNGNNWAFKGSVIYEGAGTFGDEVCLSSNGNILAVNEFWGSSNGEYYNGITRVYEFDGSDWTQLGGNIDGEEGYTYTGSGAMELSSDGKTIVLGAELNNATFGIGSFAGHARVYTFNGTNWVLKGTEIDGLNASDKFGTSADISGDGNTIIVGAPDNSDAFSYSGQVRVFEFNGTNWVQKGSSLNGSSASAKFGTAVSISKDADVITVCGFSESIQTYRYNGSDWVEFGNIDMINPYHISGDWNVDLNHDGSNMVVSGELYSDFNGNNSGTVRVLNYDGTEWKQVGNELYGSEGDLFGIDVAIDSLGKNIVVGASLADVNGLNSAGYARVYSHCYNYPANGNYNLIADTSLCTSGNASIQLASNYQDNVLLFEDFSGGLPNGWTTVDSSGNGLNWQHSNAGPTNWSAYGLPGAGPAFSGNSGFMMFDSDGGGGVGGEHAELVLPTLNCSNHQTVFLEFEHQFCQYSSSRTKVFVSNDGVNYHPYHFNVIYFQDECSGNPDTALIDISEIAANQSNVYIKFSWEGNYDYWWNIDNVKVFDGYNYTWDNASSLNSSLIPNPVASPVNTTSYTVNVNSITGCFSDSKQVTTTITSPTDSVVAYGDTTICEGSSVQIGASGSTNYTWSDGLGSNSTITVSPDSTITYGVSASNNGCTSTDSVTILVNQKSISIDTISACNSYTWIDGNTYTSSSNSATFTTINAVGCDSVITLNLTINTGNQVTIDTIINEGQSILVGSNSYTTTGVYVDTLMNSTNCDSVVTLNLTVNQGGVGINELSLLNITLYPNPTTGVFTLNGEIENIFTISVFDMMGKEILTELNTNTIDMSNQDAGIYFVEIKSGDRKQIVKMIKN